MTISASCSIAPESFKSARTGLFAVLVSGAPETRTAKRPVLADLKDSGAIEQDADIVTFVFRAEKYEQDLENKGLAIIDLAKHRNGPTGEVKLHFSDKYTKFQDLAPDDPALKNPDFSTED